MSISHLIWVNHQPSHSPGLYLTVLAKKYPCWTRPSSNPATFIIWGFNCEITNNNVSLPHEKSIANSLLSPIRNSPEAKLDRNIDVKKHFKYSSAREGNQEADNFLPSITERYSASSLRTAKSSWEFRSGQRYNAELSWLPRAHILFAVTCCG